jgi:hypothetical protein
MEMQNDSSKKQHALLSELVGLEDEKYVLEQKLARAQQENDPFHTAFEEEEEFFEIKIETHEESQVAIELKRIREDIEIKAIEIRRFERKEMGEMKSLEDISSEIWAGKPGTTGEHYAVVDDIVDGMFGDLDENDIPIDCDNLQTGGDGVTFDEEIELCFEDLFEVTDEE